MKNVENTVTGVQMKNIIYIQRIIDSLSRFMLVRISNIIYK